MTMAKPVLLGANIDPHQNNLALAYEISQLADETGLDMILSQDHPYNKDHLDTWTLLSSIAARTQRVHIGTNVANIPMRGPAMLAKQAATLDILSGGRLELGIGAGGFWRAMIAYGANPDLEAKPFTAFTEALDIIQGMWASTHRGYQYDGEFYKLKGAIPGPGPSHPIRIWVGAMGPRMQRFVGARADGISLSTPYVPYRQLTEINASIAEGAQAAGRDPQAIRHMYNLMGSITEEPVTDGFEGKAYRGSIQQWIDHLTMLYKDYNQDTFVFWPTDGDPIAQLTWFATEIAPALRALSAA